MELSGGIFRDGQGPSVPGREIFAAYGRIARPGIPSGGWTLKPICLKLRGAYVLIISIPSVDQLSLSGLPFLVRLGLTLRSVKGWARISYHAGKWGVHVASAFPLLHRYRAVPARGLKSQINPLPDYRCSRTYFKTGLLCHPECQRRV